MSNDPLLTKAFKDVPLVLWVGPPGKMAKAVEHAAVEAVARFELSDVSMVATSTASLRPLIIVMTEAVYSFDPNEFEALARDVGARVVRLSDDAAWDEVGPLIIATVESVRRVRQANR